MPNCPGQLRPVSPPAQFAVEGCRGASEPRTLFVWDRARRSARSVGYSLVRPNHCSCGQTENYTARWTRLGPALRIGRGHMQRQPMGLCFDGRVHPRSPPTLRPVIVGPGAGLRRRLQGPPVEHWRWAAAPGPRRPAAARVDQHLEPFRAHPPRHLLIHGWLGGQVIGHHPPRRQGRPSPAPGYRNFPMLVWHIRASAYPLVNCAFTTLSPLHPMLKVRTPWSAASFIQLKSRRRSELRDGDGVIELVMLETPT